MEPSTTFNEMPQIKKVTIRVRIKYPWHPPVKYWVPIHYDTIEDGQNKTDGLYNEP